MCQECNTTIFLLAVFAVSMSSTHSVKFSVFHINIDYVSVVGIFYAMWHSIFFVLNHVRSQYDIPEKMFVTMVTR